MHFSDVGIFDSAVSLFNSFNLFTKSKKSPIAILFTDISINSLNNSNNIIVVFLFLFQILIFHSINSLFISFKNFFCLILEEKLSVNVMPESLKIIILQSIFFIVSSK